MLLRIAYTVHHNEERSFSPEIMYLESETPTDKELVQIMESILLNTICHADWVCDEVVDQFVSDNRQVLIDWLFGTKQLEVTLSHDDEDRNDLFLFNEESHSKDRNIGLNTPDGHKGDGLWVEIKRIDDEVNEQIDDLLSQYSATQLAQMLAVERFGTVIDLS